MQKLRRFIAAAVWAILSLAFISVPVLAATNPQASPSGCNSGAPSLTSGISCGASNSASTSNLFGGGGLFQSIANLLLFLIGAVAVIMVIVGGFRYVISNGNPTAVEGAKNTILYAIIGIVVASLAFAIVNFVIVKL